MNTISQKYFTIEQANRTLPFVRRVVQDIVADYRDWKELVSRYELLSAPSRDEESPEQLAIRNDIERLAERISGYIDELSSIGCLFKGFEDGLVDFYGRRDGRDIFLCWRLGEPAVIYWHELDAGFAGRQPVLPEMISEGAGEC